MRADLLLGQTDRTPLTLKVRNFADGWSDLTVRNGLVLAEYCAIDRRYIQLSKPFIRPSRTPMPGDGTLQCRLPEDGYVTIRLYDPVGREVARLHDGEATAGVTHIPLPASLLSSGLYVATMTTGGEQVSVPVLVTE